MKSRYLALGMAWGIGLALLVAFMMPPLRAGDQPAPVTKESSAAFRKVVKSALPAVVSITAESRPNNQKSRERRRALPPELDEMPEGFKRFFEEFEQEGGRMPVASFGSGMIVDPQGIILTNNHVVEGADRVTITLQDGRSFKSKDIFRDPKTDVAIVRLEKDSKRTLPHVELGNSDLLEIGDWVLAMGAPFGLRGSVTAGIVSAKGRKALGESLLYQDFIQTDAAINRGNSGGPILDLDGKVVGINTAIRTNTGSFEGIGFAIPSNMAREVMDQLVKHGKVVRGYLGISMTNVEPEVLAKLDLQHGVQVAALTASNTPASKAGLKAGDIILSANGLALKDSKVLQDLVMRTPAGKDIALQVHRDGKTQKINVTIEEQPEEFGAVARVMPKRRIAPRDEPLKVEKLGMEVEASERGLVITSVEPGSAADTAGLTKGTVILEVEQQKLASAQDLNKALKKADLKTDGALFKVRTPDGTTLLMVVKEE